MRVRDAVYDESKDSCLGLFINKISPTNSPDFGIKVNTWGIDKKRRGRNFLAYPTTWPSHCPLPR